MHSLCLLRNCFLSGRFSHSLYFKSFVSIDKQNVGLKKYLKTRQLRDREHMQKKADTGKELRNSRYCNFSLTTSFPLSPSFCLSIDSKDLKYKDDRTCQKGNKNKEDRENA